MPATAVHHRWSDVPSEPLTASIARRFITADRITIARFELKRGAIVPRHSHDSEQVTCVLSGALAFRFDGHEIVVREGEVLQIPSWLEHEVEATADSLVIDVFSPVRQDWIDRTDDYLRSA
jgi:quercetin dioxygenase-like cupin family protein